MSRDHSTAETANIVARVYKPTFSEAARQRFVLGVKLLANKPMQQRVRRHYETAILPQVSARLGRSPVSRREVEREVAASPEFRDWATFAHYSQSMMWNAVEATTRRSLQRAGALYEQVTNRADDCGSLKLNPDLAVPWPIGATEIHRQPQGYAVSEHDHDLAAGLRYLGSSLIYGPAKGNAADATDARGAEIVTQLHDRFPGLAPERVLELGCGIARAGQTVARAFAPAEYHGVDVAPGLLRMAHLLARENRVPMHFHQRDAADTGFAGGSFDLVVSFILFHETSHDKLGAILRECHRLLRPGGAMLHLDVAIQTRRLNLVDQTLNDWQVRWNGEPFWTGFAETDMRRAIVDAGFSGDNVFAEYMHRGDGGAWHVFGGVRD
ncbi:MAG: class I SAM-dependent methyltransferase [Steroidobacteraceae bacterium]